ncbi:MAG: archaellin/type IV pilin N-terminal domain-containing protein [Sulfolobales archaeon]|nr:archaellin/type IV pilin N-terminal domain-containing protein [Sulfolobales archaeon]
MMAMRRAISPVIATVILIAITIVIGAAVGGWLLGLWGDLGATEALMIYPYPESSLTSKPGFGGCNNVTLKVKNVGSKDLELLWIEVGTLGYCYADYMGSTLRQQYPEVNPKLKLKPGEETTWFCRLPDKRWQDDNAWGAIPGNYLVKVVTVSGGVYQAIVPARAALDHCNW